ncbi:MAG: group 1 truncated hemoglobin [Burkholderiales bacterium]
MKIRPLVLVLAATLASAASSHAQSPASLYQRLGGYDAIAAVTDDFLGRLAGDRDLGRFFVGHSADSVKRIRQDIVNQLCAATGGPCVYTGRDMKTAHAGMGVGERDWETTVRHLNATFDRYSVPRRERDEVVAAIAGMKKDIVEKP